MNAVVIADGQTSGSLSLSILDDSRLESDETIGVVLRSPSFNNVRISRDATDLVILDDEASTNGVKVEGILNVAQESAENMFLQITLSAINGTGRPLNFRVNAVGGVAQSSTPNQDYDVSGNLSVSGC